MKKIVMTFMLMISVISMSFAQGIEFYKGDFASAQKLAKEQNKLVFVDFFTVWCGPCKMLANNVFTLKEVGDYFNNNFICCKIDAEKEGKELARKYGVNAYPTMLYLNGNGDIIYRVSGAVGADALLQSANKALAELNNPNNYRNMKASYEQNKNDEEFLARYIPKMVEFKENPREVINHYLSIQKSMNVKSSKMMEFIMKYYKYIELGDIAEKIFLENREEYYAIGTRAEEKSLRSLYKNMTRLAMNRAVVSKNVEAYKKFIDRWQKYEDIRFDKIDDINNFNLKLLWLQDDFKTYKDRAPKYIDSLVNAKTVEQIKKEDVEIVEETNKKLGGRIDMYATIEKTINTDFNAKYITSTLSEVLNNYISVIKKKKEFKQIFGWLDYAKKLEVNAHKIHNIEAKVYYALNDKLKAIECQKKALSALDSSSQEYAPLKQQLDEMEAGKYNIK